MSSHACGAVRDSGSQHSFRTSHVDMRCGFVGCSPRALNVPRCRRAPGSCESRPRVPRGHDRRSIRARLRMGLQPDVDPGRVIGAALLAFGLLAAAAVVTVRSVQGTRKRAAALSSREAAALRLVLNVYERGSVNADFLQRRSLANSAAVEERGSYTDKSMTYGELDLLLFVRILRRVMQNHSQPVRMLDIGSGSGRLVLAARLLYPESIAVVGVEILSALHQDALTRLQSAEQFATGGTESLPMAPGELRLIDYRAMEDLSSFNVVWCYATTWPSAGPFLAELSGMLGKALKSGASVVTIDKRLIEGAEIGFILEDELEGSNRDTGRSTAYIYRKE
ncbi:hypothetical protein FVE85_2674 [Porphyridium purpureum]|uniref:Histone-lysine N-methyltransferase, H3 lysine-79 specific n=1 Tax=Porphyridium purpureum TaxID=35688 RepID=A0A5J4YUJ2_PORPP|nr:hypothetical protein FVE85_2674 [Porphyridium purpureum]|eukprot:POR1501..scf227_4